MCRKWRKNTRREQVPITLKGYVADDRSELYYTRREKTNVHFGVTFYG